MRFLVVVVLAGLLSERRSRREPLSVNGQTRSFVFRKNLIGVVAFLLVQPLGISLHLCVVVHRLLSVREASRVAGAVWLGAVASPGSSVSGRNMLAAAERAVAPARGGELGLLPPLTGRYDAEGRARTVTFADDAELANYLSVTLPEDGWRPAGNSGGNYRFERPFESIEIRFEEQPWGLARTVAVRATIE